MMLDNDELYKRFNYHAPDEDKKERHQLVRKMIETCAEGFDNFIPDGREKALAITNLEQAMFWANAAIAREGAGNED